MTKTKKTCSSCGITKSRSEFNKDSGTPDGLRYNCKSCRKVEKVDATLPLQRWYTTYRVNGGECDIGN